MTLISSALITLAAAALSEIDDNPASGCLRRLAVAQSHSTIGLGPPDPLGAPPSAAGDLFASRRSHRLADNRSGGLQSNGSGEMRKKSASRHLRRAREAIFKLGGEQVFSVQFSPMNSDAILVSVERSRDFRSGWALRSAPDRLICSAGDERRPYLTPPAPVTTTTDVGRPANRSRDRRLEWVTDEGAFI